MDALGLDTAVLSRLLAYSILLGTLLGVLFDCFRISRVFLSLPDSGKFKKASEVVMTAVSFFEDVAFFIVAALTVVIFVFHTNRGNARGFILVGMLGGFFLYLATVGRLTMHSAKAICRLLRRLAALLAARLLVPIWRAGCRLAGFLYKQTLGRVLFRLMQRRRRRRSQHMARELTRFCAGIGAGDAVKTPSGQR